MSSAKATITLPLIDCGLSNDELIHTIALRYQQAMHTKSPTQPDAIRDFHLNFARNIVSRSFDGLEFICNGLNSTGKAIFCEVTGQALPKHKAPPEAYCATGVASLSWMISCRRLTET